jgi:glutathione S-transferase
MMAGVLFRAKVSGILDSYPNLLAYVARAESRPAFKRALADQFAVFTRNAAAGQL